MHTKTTFKILSAAFISCMLAACGGGGSSALQNATSGENNSIGTGTSSSTSSNPNIIGADTLQSIEFTDAVPSIINLKGTGGLESSAVRFRVLGQTGAPIKGIDVDFVLSTSVGGITLSQTSDKSDANGYVSTAVISGTISTSIKVTATATGTPISTLSNQLVVTSGVPDQNSISMGPENSEPVAWLHDNVETIITVLMADAFNNKVPDGTAVSFTTSGGAIDGSCTTLSGACSVKWRSQNPRPSSSDPVIFSDTFPFAMSCTSGALECRSGRVRILATAIGNESFVDGNGNGLYDDIGKDTFVTSNGIYTSSTKGLPVTNTGLCSPSQPKSTAAHGAQNSCDDLREAFVDKDFDGDRSDLEEFVDFNTDTFFGLLPNGKYDGALCSGSAKSNGDCTTNTVNVRSESLLVMSCESPFSQPDGRLPGQPVGSFDVSTGAIVMLLADCNGNAMPAGTTLALKTGSLINATAEVSPSGASPMSTEPGRMSIIFKPDQDTTKKPAGTVILEITAPSSTSGKLTTPIQIGVTTSL